MFAILNFVQNQIKNLEAYSSRWAPVYYILISTFMLSINTMLSKFLMEVPVPQIVYFRALVMLIMNSGVILSFKIKTYNYSSSVTLKLLLRSFFGAVGGLCFYASFKYITISEGLVLFRTSPLWTSLMAIYYLRVERFTLRLIINLALCFLGIILIVQPPQLKRILWDDLDDSPHNANQLLGVGLMVSGAILSSCIQVLISSLAGQVNQLVILQYFSFCSIFIAISQEMVLPTSYPWVMPNISQLTLLFSLGFTSYFSQLLMNRAYIKGSLTEMSMIGQIQVVYGYAFDLIMGASLSLISVLGTFMISLSLILVLLQKKPKK